MDISACNGGSCLLRLNCYRYTCVKEELGQTYFSETPYKMNMMLDEQTKAFISQKMKIIANEREIKNNRSTNKS